MNHSSPEIPTNTSPTLSHPPKTNLWPLLLVSIVTLTFGGILGYYFGANKSSPVSPGQTACTLDAKVCPDGSSVGRIPPNCEFAPCPSPQSTSRLSSSPKPASTTSTLPHEFLPGFSLAYPPGWSMEVKQFRTTDTANFTSWYFPTCHERCMGIRFSKQSISLELVFDVAFDDNLFRCSNNVEFTPVDNSWYRIKNSSGYFYNKNVSLNRRLGESDFNPYRIPSNEWSTLPNTQYQVCIQGSGNFLTQRSPVETLEGEGVPILMENPRIKGETTPQILSEIDQIVVSIKGT